MIRTNHPAPAVGPDTTALNLQRSLEAMWEDRWMLLGAHGKAEWLKRHGQHLLDAPMKASHPLLRALRRLRDEWTDLPFGDLQPLRLRA